MSTANAEYTAEGFEGYLTCSNADCKRPVVGTADYCSECAASGTRTITLTYTTEEATKFRIGLIASTIAVAIVTFLVRKALG